MLCSTSSDFAATRVKTAAGASAAWKLTWYDKIALLNPHWGRFEKKWPTLYWRWALKLHHWEWARVRIPLRCMRIIDPSQKAQMSENRHSWRNVLTMMVWKVCPILYCNSGILRYPTQVASEGEPLMHQLLQAKSRTVDRRRPIKLCGKHGIEHLAFSSVMKTISFGDCRKHTGPAMKPTRLWSANAKL